MFDLPPAYHIDRVITHLPDLRANFVCRTAVPPAPSPNPVLGLRSITPPCAPKLVSTPRPAKPAHCLWINPAQLKRAFCMTAEIDPASPQRTSHDLSSVPHGRGHSTTCLPQTAVGDGGIGQIDFLDVSRDVLPAHKKIAEGDLRRSHSAPSAIPHGSTCEPEVPVPLMPPQFAVTTSFTLGNLFLSSCPGKKGAYRQSGATHTAHTQSTQ